MQRYKAIQCHNTRRYNSTTQSDTMPRYKAVYESAKQNLPNSFMKLELNIMHGERRGTHIIQHNTNDTKAGEKPGYMPSGLAFSTHMYLPASLLRLEAAARQGPDDNLPTCSKFVSRVVYHLTKHLDRASLIDGDALCVHTDQFGRWLWHINSKVASLP